jgi:hypothetical protein
MTVLSDISSSDRPMQSELDRRVISVAGHLLMGGVWMERQLVLAPKVLGSLFRSPDLPSQGLTMTRPGKAAL